MAYKSKYHRMIGGTEVPKMDDSSKNQVTSQGVWPFRVSTALKRWQRFSQKISGSMLFQRGRKNSRETNMEKSTIWKKNKWFFGIQYQFLGECWLILSLWGVVQHASSALQASEKARNQSAKAAAARRGWQQMVIPAPQSLTWNLKISPWKRRFLLESIVFRFHVKLGGCIYFVPHQRQVLPIWSYILNEFNYCVFYARSFREELWNNVKQSEAFAWEGFACWENFPKFDWESILQWRLVIAWKFGSTSWSWKSWSKSWGQHYVGLDWKEG